MKRRARILLIFLSVMTVAAISGAFHRCYVIESLRPELKENTPPSVNYNLIQPSVFSARVLQYQVVGDPPETVLIPEYLEFSIPSILDPDPESELEGRWAIDYDGSGAAYGRDFAVRLKQGKSNEWECSFNLETNVEFGEPGRTYEVIAAISDKGWDETSDNYFAVPEQTQAAIVRWQVKNPGVTP